MISVGDDLFPVSELPKRIPFRPGGKRVSKASIYRWLGKGVGGIRLDSISIGGAMFTSMDAVQKFCDALTASRKKNEATTVRHDASDELAEGGW